MEEDTKNISTGKNDSSKKTQSQDTLKWIIVGLGGFIAVVLIFGAGMFVGGMKARFLYQWAENYHKNFAGPQGGFLGNWQGAPPLPGDFIGSHGTFGEIIKINDSDFVIKGADAEKIVIIRDDTILEKGKTAIKKDDLKVGDQVVVIGSPNEQGQIEAKLIRVFGAGDITELPRPFQPPL